MVPFLFFIIVLGVIQLIYDRDSIHIYINQYHHPFFDSFFLYLTILGGGLVFGLLLVYLFFKNKKQAIILLAGYVVSSVFVQVLKHFVFDNITRPLGHFKYLFIELYKVPGAANKTQNSFPSGHTADIFFVLCTFVLLRNLNGSTQRALFYLALLVGFSRVYLSQHFLIDIYVGAIIGVAFSIASVYLGKLKFKDLADA